MRTVGIAAALLATPLAAAAGQITSYLTLGARYPGTLVHDSITSAFDVRPSNGPAFALAFELAPYRRWSAGMALDYSHSTLRRHHADGAPLDLGGLGALSFLVSLRRTLTPSVDAGFTAGWLRYLPAHETGLFRGGTGELFPLLGLATTWQPFILRARGLGVEARWDIHRFITGTLEEHGFVGTRLAYRVTLALRANLSRLR